MNTKENRLKQLKRMKLLRILVWPYKNWKIRYPYWKYMKSENRRWLDRIKDSHKGERCFIIGNDPSLRPDDLDKLKNEFTFAANRIYEMFRLTVWRRFQLFQSDRGEWRDTGCRRRK